MTGPIEAALYIKIGTDWVSVKDWLLSKATPAEDLIGGKGYKAQRKVSSGYLNYV
jgi:hypothetical protein